MLLSKRTEIVNAVIGCFGSRGKELTAPVIESWADALEPFSVAQVRAAFTGWNRSSRFQPRPDEIVARITGRHDDKQGQGGPRRCCFVNEGQRCPFLGHYDAQPANPEAGKLCVGHDELRRDRGASIRYLEAAVAGRVPWHPSDAGWVMTCRTMLEKHGEEALLAHKDAGQRMVDYLIANPKAGTHDPKNPWELPDPRQLARDIALAEKYSGTREHSAMRPSGPVHIGEAAGRYAVQP